MGKFYNTKIALRTSELAEQNKWMAKDANAINYWAEEVEGRLIDVETGDSNTIVAYATWTSGFSLDVVADNFPVDGAYYSATASSVTVGGSDATLDRIDYIVGKKAISPATLGTIEVIEGTLATTTLVVPPNYDPSLYYIIKEVTIRALSTKPEGVSIKYAWAENLGTPTEYDFSSSSANIVVDTNVTHAGTYSIESTNQVVGNYFDLTNDSPVSTTEIGTITYWLKLKADFGSSYMFIRFYNGTSQVGNLFLIRNGKNGFDSSNLDWQKITITNTELKLPIEDFDIIRIFLWDSFVGYYIDDININTGSGNEVTYVGIEEAPKDGKEYNRKNGSWVEDLGGGGITTVVAGTNVTIDNTDPLNPIINSTGGGAALEVYSESGTLAGGDGISVIGTADVDLSGVSGDGIIYNQNAVESDSAIGIKAGEIFLKSGNGSYFFQNGFNNFNIDLNFQPSGDRSISMPDKSGTIALLSDTITAPTSNTDTGSKGEIRIVGAFRYDCIATNTWVRSAVTTSF